MRQGRELGYKGIFLSFGAFEDPEVLALGAQADGCYYSSPSFDAANPAASSRKFVDAFQKKYGRAPNVHQANHYDLVMLYAAVADGLAKQNKPLNGAKVIEPYPELAHPTTQVSLPVGEAKDPIPGTQTPTPKPPL